MFLWKSCTLRWFYNHLITYIYILYSTNYMHYFILCLSNPCHHTVILLYCISPSKSLQLHHSSKLSSNVPPGGRASLYSVAVTSPHVTHDKQNSKFLNKSLGFSVCSSLYLLTCLFAEHTSADCFIWYVVRVHSGR